MTTDDRLERLLRENARRALGLARALCGSAADADDLVQRAVLVALRKKDRIPESGGWPWLARILTLEARNWRRSQARTRTSEFLMNGEDRRSVDPEREVAHRELAADLRQEIERLPEPEREAIALIHITGLSYRDAADVLGLAPSTLSQRVTAAMQRLRKRLGLSEGSLAMAFGMFLDDIPAPALEQAVTRWLEVASGAGVRIGGSLLGGMIVAKKIAITVAAVGLLAWLYVLTDPFADADLELSRRPDGEVASTSRPVLREDTGPEGPTVSVAGDEPAEEELESLGSMSGRVLDSSGSAIVGARVRLLPEVEGRGRAMSTTTDDQGRFDFQVEVVASLMDARVGYRVEAQAEHCVASQRSGLWLEKGLGLDGLDLVLKKAASLRGRLRSKTDGSAIAGATLVLDYTPGSRGPAELARDNGRSRPADSEDMAQALTATTDAEGRFAFPGLPPGAVVIRLHAFEEPWQAARSLISGLAVLTLREGERRDDLELETSTRSLSFELAEVPGTRPWITFKTAQSWTTESLDDAGTGPYHLRGLRPEVSSVRIETSTMSSAEMAVDFAGPGEQDLGVVALVPRPHRLGRIVDADDQPVAQALVFLESPDRRLFFSTRCDDEGRFHLKDLEHSEFRVRVRHPEHAELRTDLDWPPGEDIVIRLGMSATISGRVRIAGRMPTALERGADGRMNPLTVAILDADVPLPPQPAQLLHADISLVPEMDGSFRFDKLAAGSWRVAAICDGRIAVSELLALEAGDERAIDLDIGVGATVRGRALSQGRGQAGLAVRLTRRPQSLRNDVTDQEVRTDAEGSFRFEGVDEGVWYLKLASEGMLAGTEIGERKVVLVEGATVERDLELLGSDAQISGRVLLGGQAGFKSALVFKSGVVMPFLRASMSETGEFSFKKVPDGDYYLWFVDDLFHPRRLHRHLLSVREGEKLRIEENFATASLEGNLNGAERASVSLRPLLDDDFGIDAARRHAVIEITAQGGRFSQDGLVAGRYEVLVQAQGVAPHRLECELDGVTHLDVDLRETGAELSLTVDRLEGFDDADLTGGIFDKLVIVRIFDERGEVGVLNDDRYLRLERGMSRSIPLAAGHYEVVVQGKLIETLRMPIELVAGGRVEERLALRRAAEVRLKIEGDGLETSQLAALKLSVFRPDGSRVEEVDLAIAAGVSDQISLADRVLRVLPLERGKYRILLEAPGFRPKEYQVELGRSEVHRAEIRLEPAP